MSEASITAWMRLPHVADVRSVEPSGRSVDESATAEERFAAIVAQHGDGITRFIRRMLSWGDGSEDLAQDVFATAWRRFDRLDGVDNTKAWLYRIAINRCHSHLRRQRIRQRWQWWFARCAPTVEDSAVTAAGRDETAREVRRAVAALRPKHREVVVLYYLEHHDVASIADMLGERANTVEVRLHRARRQLADMLAQFAADG